VIESIPDLFESLLGLCTTAFEQVDDCKIEVGHIPIMLVALVKFLETISARIELAFVKERSRQRYSLGVRGATDYRSQAETATEPHTQETRYHLSGL
jgi:hypothetical protein